MKLRDILSETTLECTIGGISYDSRTTEKGDVFVAVTGYKTDGHAYAKAAEQRGAVCVVAERALPELCIPCVVVPDARRALAEMAQKFYGDPTSKLRLIGVTGTNGKTTVTYLVKAILEEAGEKVGLIGTNQNMIGGRTLHTERTTPEAPELMELFAEMVREGCTYAVMEVSSHALELHRVDGCRYLVGAFTNLTQDHLDFHGTMERYRQAKSKLFDRCRCGVINADDEAGRQIAAGCGCAVTTFGISGGDLRAERIQMGADGVAFDCGAMHIRLGIPGRFSVYNALAAIGICKQCGVAEDVIVSALQKAHGVKGRAEVVPCGGDYTLLIDYAHSPDGLENILRSVKGFARGRIVVLFGCGGDRDKSKRPKMGKIAGRLADFCIVTSDNPRTEEPAGIIRDILAGMDDATADYVVIENRRDAIEYAITHAQKDDVIVLAGKGHEDYQILGEKKIHFDEREVIQEILDRI